MGFISSINAVITARTSQGAIAWIVSLNTFPAVSVPAYWIFGRNKFNGYADDWRDTHLMIAGPSVLAAQATFLIDWHWASKEVLAGLNWKPYVPPEGNTNVLLLASGPADKHETASLFFTNLLNAARKRIWIATPYFIPEEATMTALRLALLKGIEVRILTPRLYDNWFVYHAAHVYLQELADEGAKIYFYDS